MRNCSSIYISKEIINTMARIYSATSGVHNKILSYSIKIDIVNKILAISKIIFMQSVQNIISYLTGF